MARFVLGGPFDIGLSERRASQTCSLFFFFSFIFFLVSPFSFHHRETKPAMFASEYYFNNDQLQITLQIKNKNDQLRSPTTAQLVSACLTLSKWINWSSMTLPDLDQMNFVFI